MVEGTDIPGSEPSALVPNDHLIRGDVFYPDVPEFMAVPTSSPPWADGGASPSAPMSIHRMHSERSTLTIADLTTVRMTVPKAVDDDDLTLGQQLDGALHAAVSSRWCRTRRRGCSWRRRTLAATSSSTSPDRTNRAL
jgi:hypothetical protein